MESTELMRTNATLLMLNEDSPVDDFAAALDMLDAVAARIREMKQTWKAIALEHVQKHGEMVIVNKRFYAGTETVTKCKNIPAAAEAIFQASSGDWEAFVGCLASDCFKPGATKKTLPPEVFLQVFSVEPRVKLAEGEPRKKQLIEVDDRFVK